MTDPDALRSNAINAEARELGYRIEVLLDSPMPRTYTAYAQSIDRERERHFLCRTRTDDALYALERALEVLRLVREHGGSWP